MQNRRSDRNIIHSRTLLNKNNMGKKSNYIFSETDMDWARLQSFGISRQQLEDSGNLDPLLSGEETAALSVHLRTTVIDLMMDATIRLVRSTDGNALMEINGVSPENGSFEK